MTVTAELEPARVGAAPGGTSHLVLHVRNHAESPAACTLSATSGLGGAVTLDPEMIVVGPGETSHVAVAVEVPPTTPPGAHSVSVDVTGPTATVATGERSALETADDGAVAVDVANRTTGTVALAPPQVVTATATVDVTEVADHRVALRPERSRSSGRGRHQVVVDNLGNVPVDVTVDVHVVDGAAEADPATANVIVEPGASKAIPVVLRPVARFDRGPSHVHHFHVTTAASDGKDDELSGVYEQLPRVQRWHLVTAAAVLGGVLLAGLLWFALVRPAIEDIARDEAEAALADQQAAIDERIAELERAAAEAEELPLGSPTDLRLDVEVDAGDEGDDTSTVPNGTVWSITDVVLQNRTGALGTVALLRDGDVLLESQLANFRDLDLHFVAPFQFGPGSTVALRVTCDEPGPGEDACVAGATLIGFEDRAG